jgi:hypothetical protein
LSFPKKWKSDPQLGSVLHHELESVSSRLGTLTGKAEMDRLAAQKLANIENDFSLPRITARANHLKRPANFPPWAVGNSLITQGP